MKRDSIKRLIPLLRQFQEFEWQDSIGLSEAEILEKIDITARMLGELITVLKEESQNE